jgi:Ca2+-binding RTX toxin-like protein
MAQYVRYGTAATVFLAYSGAALQSKIFYGDATSFGFDNADGSKTFVEGVGLTYDTSGRLTGGTVTAIRHYSDGTYNDAFYELSIAATTLQSSLELPGTAASRDLALRQLLLAGDDTIDARFRLNDAIVAETLRGFGGNDTIYGGDGGDTLYGGTANDILNGRLGNDTLHGEDGADSVYGEDGNDILIDNEAPDGTPGRSDYLNGGVGDDLIVSGAGNDTIDGGTGRDMIKAGLGDDYIIGGPDPDVIVYEGLWSELSVAYISDQYYFRVAGREGVDKIFSAQRIGTDDGTYLYEDATGAWRKETGISGTEQLYPGRAVNGTVNNDTITVAAANANGTVVRGFGGSDTVSGGELAWGGDGNDTILNTQRAFGEAGNDSITGARYAHGGDGDDRLRGTAGNDTLFGDAGVDDVRGGSGADAVVGGGGDDRWLAGEAGDDTVDGGDGNDRLDGGDGADVLRGGAGIDYMTGGAGNDLMESGAGGDTMIGGAGEDTFDFNLAGGIDYVQDFTDNVDTLRIDPAFGFASVAQILAATTVVGSHARIQLTDGSAIYLTNYLATHTIASLADDIIIA